MSAERDLIREILALPVEQQRERLIPLYKGAYARYGVDWDANTRLMSDDYVFEKGGSSSLPGLPERVEGREGYVEAQTQLMEVVDVLRVEVDDVVALGDSRVAVLSRFVLRAGDGELDQQLLELHVFRDGLLARQVFWFDRAEGLRDVGLA